MGWLILILYLCTVILKAMLLIVTEAYEKDAPLWWIIFNTFAMSIIPFTVEVLCIYVMIKSLAKKQSLSKVAKKISNTMNRDEINSDSDTMKYPDDDD